MNGSSKTTPSSQVSQSSEPSEPLSSPWDGWMAKALELASTALPEDIPVAAIVLDGQKRVIAQAVNRRERDQDPIGHAELLAIRAASQKLKRWRLDDCTLIVTLEPCPMCASALGQARIKRVVYGARDGLYGAADSQYRLIHQHWPSVELIGGVMESACQDQLKRFFQSRRES